MLTRLLRVFTQSPEGKLWGPALDTVTSQGTAIGTTLAATTIASGDSFTVKNAALTSDVWMLNLWTHNLVAGMVRVRSPKMHDNVEGFRARTLIATLDPLIPFARPQRMIPQDTMIVELAGSAVAGNIESVCQLMYYSDLPGQAARFIDLPTLKARTKHVLGNRIAITLPTVVGYGGARAINGDIDQLHANTDYAILGATSDIDTAAICIKGPDTGNVRVSVPGATKLWQLTDRWFIKLTQEYGIPLIPVFNSANKGATNVDAVSNQAGGTANVSIILAELSPG